VNLGSGLDLMASRKHRRTAWAAGLSLVLHGLALTGMAAGLRVLTPPPEPRALELRLVPASELRRQPPPARTAQDRADVAAPRPGRPTPSRPPEVPLAAAPETPAPAPDRGSQAAAGGKGLLPDFRAQLGCNDPVAFRLTTEERRACAESLARLAQAAKPLALDIPDRKRAEYDKYARCLRLQQSVPVPSLDPNDPSSGAEVLPGGVVLKLGLGDPAGCGMGHW
jgi:hypothetical protein